jgi:tRNA dimethylallyltransferase
LIEQALKRALFVVGPTASGKTSLAVEIALLSGGEVVSADSRQIYRFMDIGTAKPGPHERKTVPHHMIDILPPDTLFSAGEYARQARTAIEDIFARDRLPVVAGGSGLYIRALADGIFDGQYRNEALRSSLKTRLNDEGAPALHRRLAAADPDAAGRIHPNDAKRIIRALEVTALAGKPVQAHRRQGRPDVRIWPGDGSSGIGKKRISFRASGVGFGGVQGSGRLFERNRFA